MTTVTKTKRNGLGKRRDLTNVIPTNKVVENKEVKTEVAKTSSNVTKEENKEAVKPVVKAPIVEKETVKPIVESPKPVVVPELTLEQKIEKVENLKILIEKREILETSRKKLNAFVIGSPQFGENIKLTDENGNTFITSNTEVFTNVIAVIKTTLIEKIKEIEIDIQF